MSLEQCRLDLPLSSLLLTAFTDLPTAPKGGYLPYWLMFTCSLAVFNSIQNFVTTSLTRRVYSRAPAAVSGLQARTFAIWTLTSASIRFCAAYHITDKAWYNLAVLSYIFALGHFTLEAVVFRTAGLGAGLMSPLVVASTSLYWMISQRDFYVR